MRSKLSHLAVIAIIAGVLALSHLGLIEPIVIGPQAEPQNYRDFEYSISFDYPESFDSRLINDPDGRIVSVYPKIFSPQKDPRVITVAYEKDLRPEVALEDTIFTLFPTLRKSELKVLGSGKVKGFEFTIKERDAVAIYSYFKANGNIYLVKFEQSYYAAQNALVPVNNRLYLGAYYSVLNSLEFEN